MHSNFDPLSQSPHILVLGTGGTIAGVAPSPAESPFNYVAGQIKIEDLLAGIQPLIPSNIGLLSKQLSNINSRDLSEIHLIDLGVALRQALEDPNVMGVVITHGTDTIEETGLFLQLTCGHHAQSLGKKVVLTAAMLPSNAPGADGPANLLNAIQMSLRPLTECPGGIFAVMGGNVCLAMDLAKRHSSALKAPIQDSPSSPVAPLDPLWLSEVAAVQAAWSDDLPIPELGQWPWVEILTSHAGARAETVSQWLETAVEGLILAGTGLGDFHEIWKEPLEIARQKGIALVRTTRTGGGYTYRDLPEKDVPGCMASGRFSAPRARIALQLALNAQKLAKLAGKPLTWQDFFARIADLPEFK
jgi:L-asparaginase